MVHLTEKMKKDIQRGLVLRYITLTLSHTDSHAMLAAEAIPKLFGRLSFVGLFVNQCICTLVCHGSDKTLVTQIQEITPQLCLGS